MINGNLKKIGIKIGKLMLICIVAFIVMGIIGIILFPEDEENNTKTDLETDLGLEAGCYYSGENPTNENEDVALGRALFCFTENKGFYVVTMGNNKYYNDTERTKKYEMIIESNGSFDFHYDGEEYASCISTDSQTFKCKNIYNEEETYKYIATGKQSDLEEYPTNVPMILVNNGQTIDITYRPLDLVITTVTKYLNSDYKIINWNETSWAIIPKDINAKLNATGLTYNSYVENLCLYTITIDGKEVNGITSFIPFNANTIIITKK